MFLNGNDHVCGCLETIINLPYRKMSKSGDLLNTHGFLGVLDYNYKFCYTSCSNMNLNDATATNDLLRSGKAVNQSPQLTHMYHTSYKRINCNRVIYCYGGLLDRRMVQWKQNTRHQLSH